MISTVTDIRSISDFDLDIRCELSSVLLILGNFAGALRTVDPANTMHTVTAPTFSYASCI